MGPSVPRVEFKDMSDVLNAPRSWRFLSVVVALAVAGGLLSGCAAPTKAPEEPTDLVWPAPPDQPRLKYVRSLSSEKNLKAGSGQGSAIKDLLLGKKKDPNEGIALAKPYGVHADREGRVLVADTLLHRLIVFDLKKNVVSEWGDKGKGRLITPIGVTSDSLGRVYVTDSTDQRVVVYDRSGKYLYAWNPKEVFERPTGIAIDEKRERIYVVDTKKHRIFVLNMRGDLVSTIGEKGNEPGQFLFPVNLAVGGNGRLFVVDTMNNRVQILDPEGKPLKAFGKNSDAPGNFARPKGLALDPDGNIYVADAAFNNFQIFNQDGEVLLIVGKGGFGPGQFQLPAGAFMDARGRLYVVDQLNSRVQIFQYLSADTAKKPAS